MKVYSFDIDETLEISNGPVTIQSMMDLKLQGNVVGLCGNWALFVQAVKGWQNLISFVNCAPPLYLQQINQGPVRMDKAWFLMELKKYIPADDYVHVGNRPGCTNKLGVVTNSEDEEAARIAGWRFLLEDSFANGER